MALFGFYKDAVECITLAARTFLQHAEKLYWLAPTGWFFGSSWPRRARPDLVAQLLSHAPPVMWRLSCLLLLAVTLCDAQLTAASPSVHLGKLTSTCGVQAGYATLEDTALDFATQFVRNRGGVVRAILFRGRLNCPWGQEVRR